MLSHVGLKLTPLALYESVREDHQELATPVDAVNYILRHRHSNLNNTEYPSPVDDSYPSLTHLEISFMNADSKFWIFLFQFWDKLLGHPVVLLLTVRDEDVIQRIQLFLLKVPVFSSLFHQPEGNKEPSSVGDDDKDNQNHPHSS